MEHAPATDVIPTPALAHVDTQEPTARLILVHAPTPLARTEEAALQLDATHILALVHVDIQEPIVRHIQALVLTIHV